MSLKLRDQLVCSLHISGAVFLDKAPEHVGVGSFCVCMRHVKQKKGQTVLQMYMYVFGFVR